MAGLRGMDMEGRRLGSRWAGRVVGWRMAVGGVGGGISPPGLEEEERGRRSAGPRHATPPRRGRRQTLGGGGGGGGIARIARALGAAAWCREKERGGDF